MSATARGRASFVVAAALATLATLAAAARPAAAQEAPTSSPTAAPNDDAVAAARQHYRRGAELYAEGDFVAAALEFRRAYALAPSYKLRWNLAQVYVQLQDYASALDAFERYLAEGGAEVGADQRAEAAASIARLTHRVASLDVRTNVPGVAVAIDDHAVGTTPMKPVRVSEGQRHLVATKPGYVQQTRVLELAGGDAVRVVVDLEPTPRAAAHTEGGREGAVIGWAATAALVLGAAVTGGLALAASSDAANKRDTFGAATSAQIHDAEQRARTFALVTDVLGGAAIVAAGVSLYLTVRPRRDAAPAKAASALDLRVGPRGVGVVGSF